MEIKTNLTVLDNVANQIKSQITNLERYDMQLNAIETMINMNRLERVSTAIQSENIKIISNLNTGLIVNLETLTVYIKNISDTFEQLDKVIGNEMEK